jgi:hypothetical protein
MRTFFRLLFSIVIGTIFLACNKEDNEEIKLIPVKAGENFQYVDREGKIVINPQFSAVSIFREGMALVKTSGENAQWGYINEEGKYIINPTYLSATIFSEDIAWVVSENGAPVAIDSKGQTKFTLQDAQTVRIFKEELAAFSTQDSIGERWGFVDKSGKIKIPVQFDYVGNFNNGKCVVKNKDGKYGYIDSTGKIIINYQFDKAMAFQNDMAVVALKDKAGVIDAAGKYIINPQFQDMYPDGSMFAIQVEKKWGWCDKDGKIIINPQFDDVFPFNDEDLAAVKSGKMSGYINKEGKIIINPQFDEAFPFNNNLALVSSGDKYGFVDGQGKYLVNPQFDGISYDMAYYLYSKSTVFESVETDFFNIEAIVEKININSPDGLSLKDNAGKILEKLKKTSADLSKYDSNQLLYSDKKITKEATLSLSLLGSAFKIVESGWSYDRVFDPNLKTEGFIYNISLSGKGYEKGLKVKEAFDKELSKLTKIKAGFIEDEEVSVYKDQTKYVVLSGNKNSLRIYIVISTFDLTNYMARILETNVAQNSNATEEVVAPIEEAAPATVDTTAYSY